MLLLSIIAFVATLGFLRRSRVIGASSGKIASIPFASLCLLLAIAYLVNKLVLLVGGQFQVSTATTSGVLIGLNVLVVLTYLAIISAVWKALNQKA